MVKYCRSCKCQAVPVDFETVRRTEAVPSIGLVVSTTALPTAPGSRSSNSQFVRPVSKPPLESFSTDVTVTTPRSDGTLRYLVQLPVRQAGFEAAVGKLLD